MEDEEAGCLPSPNLRGLEKEVLHVRLHPAVTQAEAYAWLKNQVDRLPANARPEALDAELLELAEAMASISHVAVPDEIEPLWP